MAGTVSRQNTTMSSNMIFETPYGIQKAKKMVFDRFKLQILAEIDRFLHFLILRLREF